MSESNEFNETTQEMVRANGDEVAIHTEKCVLWKLEHPNCAGCPSELGCGKVARLIFAMMTPLMYQPKSYDDFARMEERLQEIQNRILNAKTVDEMEAVPKH